MPNGPKTKKTKEELLAEYEEYERDYNDIEGEMDRIAEELKKRFHIDVYEL